MEINKEKVQKLAKLARLMFTSKETKSMQVDLKKILTFINKLDELNADDVSPLTHIHNNAISTREDQAIKTNIKAEILKNSPNHNSDYVKVPKVLSTKNNAEKK